MKSKLVPIEKIPEISLSRHVLGAIVYQQSGFDSNTQIQYQHPFPVAPISMYNGQANSKWLNQFSIPQESSRGVAELWITETAPSYFSSEKWSIAQSDGWLFATISFAVTGENITENTRRHYNNLFRAIDELGYPQLIRMWNYMPAINRDEAGGLERYRGYCLGRALAFSEHFPNDEAMMPAASGVGSQSGLINITALARCSTNDVVHMENPRQTPAYKYPTAYGPRAPSFARATSLILDKKRQVIFISGTASIVNSESLHKGDCQKQLDVTFKNISLLISTENLKKYGLQAGYTLTDLSQIKVYYRHPQDLANIQVACNAQFSDNTDIVYLHADICRHDLDVEIEGVVDQSLQVNDGRAEPFQTAATA